MIKLYDYQDATRQDIYDAIRLKKQRILAIAVMGSGKTVLSSWIMRECVQKDGRVVFLVMYEVLIDQTLATLAEMGVRATGLQGNRIVDKSAPIIVASIQTIRSRLRHGFTIPQLLGQDVRLIFADEAHLLAFDSIYDLIVGEYSRAIAIGLTATPWRLSQKQWLGQKYEHVVVGPQPPEIIKRGKAVPCRGFEIEGIFDVDALDVQAGDYIENQMVKQASRPGCLDHVIGEWKRISGDRTTLMVGAGVEQARKQSERFNQHGYSSVVIEGKTSKRKRRDIFKAATSGEIQIICSVGCLTAGFNLPRLSSILYIRATKSRALFHQTAGRGSRMFPGKSDYHLLDFGGNLHLHGDPMGEQDYNIWGDAAEVKERDMLKICPDCQNKVSVFLSKCCYCGYMFSEPEEKETLGPDLIQLSEYFDEATNQKFNQIRHWRRDAWKQKLSPDTPIEHFRKTHGHLPPNEWLKGATAIERGQYIQYLEQHGRENRWKGQWIQYHLSLEYGD